MRILAIMAVGAFVILAASPAEARCFKFQRDCGASAKTPKTHILRNIHRQKIGDIYNPGHGRNIQIRNNHRQIIGYIERDGDITNIHRQPVGSIENILGIR